MKYKKYPQYKDSGVDWLGKIPSDWDVARVKNSSKIFNGATPKSGTTEYWDGDISWIGPADMGKISSRYISGGARNITYSGYDSCGTTIIPEGSVILSSRAPIGKVAIAGKELCTNQGCKSLIVNKYFSNIFIFYILTSNTVQLNLLGRGTTFLELSAEELSSFNIPIPSLEEQQAIANYLDSATAKIDILIEKQTKLIALLKEKRQAVISTAVTRGLENQHGDWNKYRLDWVSSIVRGNIGFKKDELLDNGEYVALQYGKTYKVDEVNKKFEFYINKEFYKFSQLVHCGDTILISTSETVEDLGHSCFYNRDDLGLIGGEQILLKPDTKLLCDKYLYYSSKVFCSGLKKYASGLKVFRFNTDDLKKIFISIPSLENQQDIANYIDDKTSKIDILIEKSTKSIVLLKERRVALISAAVTGKINVREIA